MRAVNQYYRALSRNVTPPGPDPDAFIMTFALGASDSITLPLVNTGTYAFDVDWGDGNSDNITVWNQAERIHTYTGSPAGNYIVTITGTFTRFSFFDVNTSRSKLIKINNWGDTGLTTLFRSFRGATNLTSISDAGPIPATVLNMFDTFTQCAFPSINADAFSLLSGCITFQQCFNSIAALLGLPSGLLSNCAAALNFQNFASSCPNLASIPTDLFNACVNATQYDFAFSGDTALNVNLSTLVSGMNMSNVTTTREMFNGCGNIIGLGADLIAKTKAGSFTVCALASCSSYRTMRNCASLTDFATIPSDWK